MELNTNKYVNGVIIDLKTVVILIGQGYTKKDIARHYGCSVSTIYKFLNANNLSIEINPEHNKRKNVVRKQCKTCIYRSDRLSLNSCDYICITNHSRGCDASECDKYKKGKRLKKSGSI